MTETEFWSIIETAKGDADRVTAVLKKVTPKEIEAFNRIYWEKHNQLHHWDIWRAAYVICEGCSDDGFHYFKAWAIGKGEKFFEALKADPDSIEPFVTQTDLDNGCDNESLNYAAIAAYETITRQELDQFSNEDEDPAGERWDDENPDAAEKLPKLWARFGG